MIILNAEFLWNSIVPEEGRGYFDGERATFTGQDVGLNTKDWSREDQTKFKNMSMKKQRHVVIVY